MKKLLTLITGLLLLLSVDGQILRYSNYVAPILSTGGGESTLWDGLTAVFDLQETIVPIVDEIANLTSIGTVGTTAINYSQTGISGNCMHFNYLPSYGSGQRIIVGNDLLLHGTLSVSLWFYVNDSGNDAYGMVHNNNGGSQNRGYFLFTGGAGGGVAARAYNSSGDYVETDSAPEWTVPAANTWYNYIFVADGTNLSIYINGTLRSQDSFPYSIDYGSDSVLIIGGRDAANGWCFSGRLDEIYFYNRALTSTEITNLQTQFYPFN